MLKILAKNSVLTVIAVLFAFAFAGTTFAEEGDEELVVQPVELEAPDLPVGGWAPAEPIYVPTDIVVNGSSSSDEMKSSKKRINADPDSVFAKGAASRGYEALNSTGQELYDAIHKEVCEFMEEESDLGPTPVKMKNETVDCYIFGVANYSKLGITDDQEALKVFYAYDYDHPADYWISNQVLFNGENLYLCTEEEYASVSTRRVLDTLVSDSVKAYAEMAGAEESTLDKIAMVHDTIVNDIDYAYDSNGQPVSAKWAHSVHGVFDPQYEQAVCEGYADAFALIMNYMDIPNYYIVGTATTGGPGGGGGHAWNAVYDEDIDLYFYMDLTWDDLGEEDGYSYKYFGMPMADFEVSHTKQGPSAQMGEDWLYDVPGDYCDNFEDTYYKRGGFYYDGSTDADEFVAAAKAKAARSGGWVSILCPDTDNFSIIDKKLGGDGLYFLPASYEGKDYYLSTAPLNLDEHTHIWSTPSYTWAPDNSKVSADRICEAPNCNVIAEVETVDTTFQGTRPTCTEGGQGTYSATFADPDFSVEPKDVTLEALGHDWGKPTYTWASGYGKVTAKHECSRQMGDSCTETETAKTTSKITRKATYTAKGQTTYTAAFKNPAFKASKTVTNIRMLNPMKVKVTTKTVKVKTLKKKTLTVVPLKVTYAKGKMSYKVVGGNAKSKKALSLNTKTGKVTVKKKTKKGKYQIKVKVTAAGTTAYQALSKTVTVTVKAK